MCVPFYTYLEDVAWYHSEMVSQFFSKQRTSFTAELVVGEIHYLKLNEGVPF